MVSLFFKPKTFFSIGGHDAIRHLPVLRLILLTVVLWGHLLGDQHYTNEWTKMLTSIAYLGFELGPSGFEGKLSTKPSGAKHKKKIFLTFKYSFK